MADTLIGSQRISLPRSAVLFWGLEALRGRLLRGPRQETSKMLVVRPAVADLCPVTNSSAKLKNQRENGS